MIYILLAIAIVILILLIDIITSFGGDVNIPHFLDIDQNGHGQKKDDKETP